MDAILKKTLFRGSYIGKLLVCNKVHKTLPESVEKPFVAIFLGLGGYFPYIDLTKLNINYCLILLIILNTT